MEHFFFFEGVSLPVARHFFKKVCEIGSRHSEEHYAHELGLRPQSRGIESESILRVRINQLEEDLLKTSEERDAALEENRARINELESKLMSIKSILKDIIEAKKRRMSHLEEKIRKTVK